MRVRTAALAAVAAGVVDVGEPCSWWRVTAAAAFGWPVGCARVGLNTNRSNLELDSVRVVPNTNYAECDAIHQSILLRWCGGCGDTACMQKVP
jgi:hypothetical protein